MSAAPIITVAIISSLALVFTFGSRFVPRAATQPVHASSVTEQTAKRLEPALSLPSYTNPRLGVDFRDGYDDAQLGISSGNLIFYTRGTQVRALDPITQRILWQQPLPWLFTAWRDLFFTADQRGLVTAYNARTQAVVWRTQVFQSADAPDETRYLRMVGQRLMVNGRNNAQYAYTTSALEPASGRVVWSKNTPAPYLRSVGVALDRYIIDPTQSDSPMGPPPPSYLDAKTGWYFERDASILNQSLSGSEFVKLESPHDGWSPIGDFILRDSYTVRLSVYSNAEHPARVQDLGSFDLTPPLECLGENFGVNLYNGNDPNLKGRMLMLVQRGVGFVAVNADTVWLEVTNDCGRRLAYISRSSSRQVSYLSVPETLSLEQRYAQYRSSGGRIGIVRGHIPVQILMNLFGESFALATVGNAFAFEDVLWLEERQGRVYALLRNKELRIYDSSAKLLERYFLALPSLQYEPKRDDPNGVDLSGRVFTWRSSSLGASYFFVIPN